MQKLPENTPAISYMPVTPIDRIQLFICDQELTQINDVERRIIGLAMDLLVSEALREKRRQTESEDHWILFRTASGDRPFVTVKEENGDSGLIRVQTKLGTNLQSAHSLINHLRTAAQLDLISHTRVYTKVPEFSAHERMRLEALDPDLLLPDICK